MSGALVVDQVLVQRHADAHATPPLIWLVAVSGFMMRPRLVNGDVLQ